MSHHHCGRIASLKLLFPIRQSEGAQHHVTWAWWVRGSGGEAGDSWQNWMSCQSSQEPGAKQGHPVVMASLCVCVTTTAGSIRVHGWHCQGRFPEEGREEAMVKAVVSLISPLPVSDWDTLGCSQRGLGDGRLWLAVWGCQQGEEIHTLWTSTVAFYVSIWSFSCSVHWQKEVQNGKH